MSQPTSASPLSPAQTSAILQALQLHPVGAVPDAERAYARRWFGPQCVRLETTGQSVTDYNDDTPTERGDLELRGFDLSGQELPALASDDPDEQDSYFEVLARWEADPSRDEDGRPVPIPAENNDEALHNMTGESTGMDGNQRYYWGPAEHDPYRSERELLRRLAGALGAGPARLLPVPATHLPALHEQQRTRQIALNLLQAAHELLPDLQQVIFDTELFESDVTAYRRLRSVTLLNAAGHSVILSETDIEAQPECQRPDPLWSSAPLDHLDVSIHDVDSYFPEDIVTRRDLERLAAQTVPALYQEEQ